MMSEHLSVLQLKCSCNNYPWGKKGRESMAARLCAQTPGTDFRIDDEKEYAEMWMGTYPVTPSYVLSTGGNLQDVLNSHKEALIGKSVLEKFGSDLPFLPKVLSIAKALPLQIHPNKKLAEKLHEKDPEKYGDANHKPEIAVALSRFEVFAGFKDTKAISNLLQLEPLRRFLPDQPAQRDFDSDALRTVCRTMLEASEVVIKETQSALGAIPRDRLGDQAYILDLLPRLQEQYTSADNGTLVALVCMNFMVLQPGEAIYVPADGIHAYLSGDIIECMARSDNVINSGFCPRPDRDSIELFTSAMTFSSISADEMLLESSVSGKSKNGKTRVYKPALSEFNTLVTALKESETEVVDAVHGPSIMIVTAGSGSMVAGSRQVELEEGFIFFIGQGVSTEITARGSLTAHRSYAE